MPQYGRDFAEVLVSWGLVDQGLLRLRLGAWLAESLSILLSLEQAETVFVPREQNYPEAFTFGLDDLHIPSRTSIPAAPPATDTEFDVSLAGISGEWTVPAWLGEVQSLTQAAMALDAVKAATVLHEATGQSLARAGGEIPRAVLAANLRLLLALRAEGQVGAIRAGLNGDEHVMLQLPQQRGCVLYVVFDGAPAAGAVAGLSASVGDAHDDDDAEEEAITGRIAAVRNLTK